MGEPIVATAAPSPPPLPSPPFIPCDGLPNLRDIGGYPVVASAPGDPPPDGRTTARIVRRGLVFRSSDPGRLEDTGVAVLQGLGVARVFDLRSAPELAKAQAAEGWDRPREWDGAERVFAPVFLDEDYGPEAVALRFRDYGAGTEGFVRAYASILAAAAAPANSYAPYRAILSHLATPPSASGGLPRPILVHCKGGKDRTGVLCALVLSLCGVPDDVVAHEYSLTEAGLRGRREGFVRYILAQHPSMDREAAETMIGASKGTMLATLDMIRAKYGSVERYVIEECGLSSEDVAQLRRNLIVDADEGTGQGPVDWESNARALAQAK